MYVTGIFSGNDDDYPPRIDDDVLLPQSPIDYRRIFIAKFDQEGVFQWIQRPQAEGVALNSAWSFEMYIDTADIIHWFVWLEPGVYADGAFVHEGDDPDIKDLFVFKYDTAGNFMSAVPLSFRASGGAFTKMYRNPYNGYYYIHFMKGGDSTVVSINGEEVVHSTFIACFDTAGVFQWIRENSTTDTASKVQIKNISFDIDNNIYIGGYMPGLSTDTFLGITIPEMLSAAFVLKTNPTATTTFWSTYPNKATSSLSYMAYRDGEVGITTCSGGGDFIWGDLSIDINTPGTGQDVIFARFDPQTGATIDLKSIRGDNNYQDYGTCLAIDNAGDYLVGGGVGHFMYDAYDNYVFNEGGYNDFFVAKYATSPCPGIGVEELEEVMLSLYPNPTKNSFIIESEQLINQLSVYTLLGQEVITLEQLSTNKLEIDSSTLASGTYMVSISIGVNTIRRRLVKE